MSIIEVGKRCSEIAPGKISIKYTYPGDRCCNSYTSYDANSILNLLQCVESNGCNVIELYLETQSIPEDRCYIGWCSYYQLINHLHENIL